MFENFLWYEKQHRRTIHTSQKIYFAHSLHTETFTEQKDGRLNKMGLKDFCKELLKKKNRDKIKSLRIIIS